MAKLKVSIPVPLTPEVAWEKASNLEEFDTWLSIHEAWRGELPDVLAAGATVESVVTVKGLRNRVRWTITEYESPRKLALKGAGRGGVKIGLVLAVTPKGATSEIAMNIDLGGAPLFGPIGAGVARALEGDIESSLQRFVTVFG